MSDDRDDTDDLEDLKRRFRFFAGMCAGDSPLYETLSAYVARTPEILALAASRERRQPPVNLLFGAVHELLLAGAAHPLAEFYPSVGGERAAGDACPVFADFCRRFREPIVERVVSRRVQTNEVRRCGLLLPALAMASEMHDGRPLHLVELGCSAGLNLRLDEYHYTYTVDEPPDGASAGRHACGPDAAARIRTRLQGNAPCPVPAAPPPIAGRVGVDIAPVDLADDDAVRWVEAMIWPDQLQRIELFRAAVGIARATPVRVVRGDGLDVVPGIVASAPADALPCVFHSHAIYQTTDDWRDRFQRCLAELSRERDLVHVSLEWLLDDPGPRLRMTSHGRGTRRLRLLADCDHHGRWMRRLPVPDADVV